MAIRFFFHAVAVTGLLSLAGCDSESRASRNAFERGVDAHDYEDYETAIEELTQVVEHDPKKKEAFVRRADSYYQLERYEEAGADYGAALRLDLEADDLAFLRFRRGVCYYRREWHADALRDLYKVIHDEPDHWSAWLFAGYACQALGRNEEAVERLTKAISRDDDVDESAYIIRAWAYEALGKDSSALTDFTTAIHNSREKGRDNPWYHIRRGQFNYRRENYDAATRDFNNAIELAPELAYAWHERAVTRYARKHYARAFEDMQRAIELDATESGYRETLGGWYQERGKPALAEALYTEAIEKLPTDPNWYSRRASAYRQMNEFDKALTDYEQITRLSQRSADGFLGAAEIYELQRRWDEALVAYDAAYERENWNLAIKLGRARMLGELGRTADCEAACQEIIDQTRWLDKPEYFAYGNDYRARVHLLLARIRADEGNTIAATREARRADYFADDAAIRAETADVYERLGNSPAADMNRFLAIEAAGLQPAESR